MARGKGDGALYRQADGLWACSIELPAGPDQRRRKVVRSKDKGALVRKLRELQAQLAEQGDMPTASWRTDKWLTHWLDDIAPRMKTRPKTLAGYRSGLTHYAIPEIGHLKLEQITPEHIRRIHDRVTSTPKPRALRGTPRDQWPEGTPTLSSTYALNVHNALAAALGTAEKEGLLRSNPCDKADRPRPRNAEQKALTLDQAIDLLAYCTTIPDGPLWAAYLLTGARRGELLGLEADRVTDTLDLSWQLQRIANLERDAAPDYEHRHVTGSLYLTRPKSEKGWRVIPLFKLLRPVMGLALQSALPNGLVFSEWVNTGTAEEPVWAPSGQPWDPDRATARWKEVLAGAGLPDDVVLHGARHTTVDLLYMAEVPEDIIMDIVGHSTRSTTRGYRSRAELGRLLHALDGMGDRLAIGRGGNPDPDPEGES